MTLSGETHICSAGESWDSVALAVYGDEKYACELMCANPGYCLTQFAGGETLALPVVEIAVDLDGIPARAPWKE